MSSRAHAMAPAPSNGTPGHPNASIRQYDLKIDGQSVFQMPKVYQLGVAGALNNRKPGHRSNYRTYNLTTGRYEGPDEPRNVDEEEAALQSAIAASLAESKRHLESTSYGTTAASSARSPVVSNTNNTNKTVVANTNEAPAPPALPTVSAGAEDLLDLLAEPSVPAAAGPDQFQQYHQYSNDPFGITAPPPAAPIQTQQQPDTAAPAQYSNDPFSDSSNPAPPAPSATQQQQPTVDPFAAAPQENQQYMPQLQTNFAMPVPPAEAAPVVAGQPPSSTDLTFTAPLEAQTQQQQEQQQQDSNVDLISQGLESLVNLTDLKSPGTAAVAASGNTYNPFDLSMNASSTNAAFTSDPNAPQPSLGEIQKIKSSGASNAQKEPIMKSPPGVVVTANTSLVLHAGQQQGNYGGYANYGAPPPIQQRGFGVGAMSQQQPAMYGGQQQQMSSPMMSSPSYGPTMTQPQQQVPPMNMNGGGGMYAGQPPPVMQQQQQQQFAYPP
eukprot:CAMPEP_0116030362 /NCGR_PEP_ID=MMETSP0321-20121206/16808_1 /TAXON_ID=163516 /ORGANISM="Leptocylindrus danicus var. danicus, Strain B650" /LENGTH=494 /DNA_ID=CAMNT_0003505151 /DNA_START=212 /DNA_END=1693 /DNA_ORIENTATION=+